MPFSEEDKIFINNSLDLKGYNGKHLVREFPQQKLERRPCLPVVAKAMGYWAGRPLFRQQQMLQDMHI